MSQYHPSCSAYVFELLDGQPMTEQFTLLYGWTRRALREGWDPTHAISAALKAQLPDVAVVQAMEGAERDHNRSRAPKEATLAIVNF